MAQALGAPELADLVAQRASLMSTFVSNYNQGGYFGTSPTDGAQTANAFALAIGAPAPKDTQAIVDYIVKDIAARASNAHHAAPARCAHNCDPSDPNSRPYARPTTLNQQTRATPPSASSEQSTSRAPSRRTATRGSL